MQSQSKMTEFDDDILRCLFSKRYMDFRTCSSLRSVSARFGFFAAKYCLSLKELDIAGLTKAFNSRLESFEKIYHCLVETVAEYCPKLQKIAGVRIIPENLNLASRKCLEGLPYLTSVAFEDDSIEMSIVYSFLKRLPNLRSVKLNVMEDWSKKVADMPEEEKLAVADLSLNFGDFWRVFRVDCLKKLSGLKIQLKFDTAKFDKNKTALARCQNLEQLDLVIDIYQFDSVSFPAKFRSVEALLVHLELLTVNIKINTSLEIANESMHQFPLVWQHVQNLELFPAVTIGSCCLLWHFDQFHSVRAYDYPPPTLSKSHAVGLPSPQKVASHTTQSILTLPPTDQSHTQCVRPPTKI